MTTKHRALSPGRMLVFVAAGLLTTGNAWAASYAVSTNNITNFSLSLPNNANFSGFTFSTDAAVAIGALTGGDVNIAAQDAPAACVGSYCSTPPNVFNNQFYSHGASLAPGYSYGDAQILSTNVTAGAGAASSIGEATVFNGFATSAGANTMMATFSLPTSGTLNFSFLSAPVMNTVFGSGALAATANIDMNITILSGFTPVFQWSPNGQAGGITGGAESADPFNLNFGIAGNASYSPVAASFGASTNTLSAGFYSMNIHMGNSVNVAAVPVPAALPLFGSGILTLAALARRRIRS